jgi:ribosomal protein S18
MTEIKKAPKAKKEETEYKKPMAQNNDMGDNDFDGGDGDFGGYDVDKDRKMFAKKRSDWFLAKKTSPDWKDPSTYAWLVNEFGKISPARVTGLTPKNHRLAVAAIKRGRAMGLISYLSNQTAK